MPFSKSVNTYDSSVVVKLAISFPVESLTLNTAPAKGASVSWSIFVIFTTTFLGAFSNLTVTSLLEFEISNVDLFSFYLSIE